MTDQPLLTMVKKQELGPKPSLTTEDELLEQTLCMLCSFYSLDDLMSFIASQKFVSLASHEPPWIGFEIGIYKEHTKTIEFIASPTEFVLADSQMSGTFDGNIWRGEDHTALHDALKLWLNISMSEFQ